MATRPFGIAILSMLTLLLGGLLLLGGVMIVVASGVVAAMPEVAEEIAKAMRNIPGVPVPLHSLIAIGTVLAVIGVIILIVSVITLLVGWGLWTARNWARWIAIIYFGLSALSNLIDLMQGQIGAIISLFINGLIVYYLFTPRVKAFFRAAV